MSQIANNWVIVKDDGSTKAARPKGNTFLSPWLHTILLCGFPERVGAADFEPYSDPGNHEDFRMIFAKAACDLLDVQDLDHDEWSYPLGDNEVILDTR